MQAPIRLVIADDHEIFRDGLALMLETQDHIALVGQAENGKQLLSLVNKLIPDVIMTDIKMPHMDGIEATRNLIRENPDRKIIALSMFDEENLIVDMLEAGAKGYLLKNADKAEILEAISHVYDDKNYYCRHTSGKLASLIAKSSFNASRKIRQVTFTDRELEIIRLICQQCTAQQIAAKIFLSPRTVEGHRTRILEKMNVRNAAGVVIYALKHNIISEGDVMS